MQQVELVYTERTRMLDYALERYREKKAGGLLFFYFSTVDLASHMMWRHTDPAHPAHDPAFAAMDSSDWSGREGSVWLDTVEDLYLRMDPVLGRIREELGDDTTIVVMSDHGFAPYRREFGLNAWLHREGYLVLKDDVEEPFGPIYGGRVDWTRTRAYGMGFNGLYLNLAGRELDDPSTPEDESGIVQPGAEAEALLAELKAKLEAVEDPETGLRPILRCDRAEDVYAGVVADQDESGDLLVEATTPATATPTSRPRAGSPTRSSPTTPAARSTAAT